MTKSDLLILLDGIDDTDKVILYDGDDSTFNLSYYGSPTSGEIWLKVEFDTTVDDL